MTRFARKTSTQGNTKREPEEATPWSQMVAQVKPRARDIEEEEDDFMEGVEEGGPAQDRGDSLLHDRGDSLLDEPDSDDEKADIVPAAAVEDDDDESEEEDYETRLAGDEQNSGGNSLKRKPELISSEEPAKKKKKKRTEKCKICGSKEHRKMDCGNLSEERRKELQELFALKVGRAGQGTGRHTKNKKVKEDADKLPYEETGEAKKEDGAEVKSEETEGAEKPKKKKKKNNRNSKRNQFNPKEEKKDRSGAIVEEGEAIFHGFRVRKEDEKRLQALYKELKTKGLTKKELDMAIKKERRSAEKTLARSKKMVCFKCRQPGHMLADCPMASSEDKKTRPNTGICFKCGSLEHISKDCKSKKTREDAYNFATCFICKQDGHLAKTCPDNPRGLYPKGGGCVFCGSVEHLKRDCQRKVQKDMRSGLVVGTISDNLEDEPSHAAIPPYKKKKKVKQEKVVAF